MYYIKNRSKKIKVLVCLKYVGYKGYKKIPIIVIIQNEVIPTIIKYQSLRGVLFEIFVIVIVIVILFYFIISYVFSLHATFVKA